jgi:hypothetical protein
VSIHAARSLVGRRAHHSSDDQHREFVLSRLEVQTQLFSNSGGHGPLIDWWRRTAHIGQPGIHLRREAQVDIVQACGAVPHEEPSRSPKTSRMLAFGETIAQSRRRGRGLRGVPSRRDGLATVRRSADSRSEAATVRHFERVGWDAPSRDEPRDRNDPRATAAASHPCRPDQLPAGCAPQRQAICQDPLGCVDNLVRPYRVSFNDQLAERYP